MNECMYIKICCLIFFLCSKFNQNCVIVFFWIEWGQEKTIYLFVYFEDDYHKINLRLYYKYISNWLLLNIDNFKKLIYFLLNNKPSTKINVLKLWHIWFNYHFYSFISQFIFIYITSNIPKLRFLRFNHFDWTNILLPLFPMQHLPL